MSRSPDGLLQLDLPEGTPRGRCAALLLAHALAAAQFRAVGAQLLEQLQRQGTPRALVPAHHFGNYFVCTHANIEQRRTSLATAKVSKP